MGEYVASQIVKALIKKKIKVGETRLLMLGITFKENCPDVRNTKIVDVVEALRDYGISVTIYDPWANPAEVKHEYGLDCVNDLSAVHGSNIPESGNFDAIVLAVAHQEFLDLDLKPLKKENSVVYDVKGILKDSDLRL